MQSRKRILQLTAGTEGQGGRGEQLHKVRGKVHLPRVHKQFYSHTSSPSTPMCSQQWTYVPIYIWPEQAHPWPPRTSLISSFCCSTSSLEWQSDWGPTGATATGRNESAPDSHSGKELVIAKEDPLFVPGFVISLAKALCSCRALDRVPGKTVLKPLV